MNIEVTPSVVPSEQLTIMRNLISDADRAYEDFVLWEAKFKQARSKLNRVIREIRLMCGASDSHNLDLANGTWTLAVEKPQEPPQEDE